MNNKNLNELIDKYEEKLPLLYDAATCDELFKWAAVRCFQENWFAPDEKFPSFIDRFKASIAECSILMDGAIMHPNSGVVKLYEQEPEKVEHLFRDVLFADDGGDITLRQQHMDEFLEGMEEIRIQYFPRYYSYKQDRHSASCYLAMYKPEENYIYRFSSAEAMAIHAEFGFDIGAGASFSLAKYYMLCDEIVSQLKEHQSLLDKHFAYLKDGVHYKDESLHLLAFDLQYCCRTYNYYKGIHYIPKKRLLKDLKEEEKKQKAEAEAKQKEAEKEAARLAQIAELEDQIAELESTCADISDIDLLNVEVQAQNYGAGVIVAQNLNRVTVQFADRKADYFVHKKYMNRPIFENDNEFMDIISSYGDTVEKIKKLQDKIDILL